ncbi:MAG: hypothetical protein DRJ01_04590 [Bacteroidetes bacterium]|nr:MAG: hypothetical protein DRJ01_04590 [Bacteroidota bacterium]
MYLKRQISAKIKKSLSLTPATAILGARQTGKTTFVKHLLKNYKSAFYLDLEKPSDRNMLNEAEHFFMINNNKLICLDEIQLVPDLFPVIRSIIDDDDYNIKFLVTGSASPNLLRQSSESLAGRIAYFELSPFLLQEISEKEKLENYWLKGGFPLSLLSTDNELSNDWRQNFILTFLERDLQNFGFNIPPETLHRLWKMIAHLNGQILNYSQLSNSLGYSDTTIRKYIDILSNTYMLRILQPYHFNIKKRLIKSPKIYIRDTGILNTLLNINDFNELFTHPVYGSSWEILCIENIINTFKNWEPFYYRTSNGNEIDLVLIRANKKIAIEFKTSTSPTVSKGFWNALDDLKTDMAFIIAPVKMAYPYKNNVWIYPINEFLKLKLL